MGNISGLLWHKKKTVNDMATQENLEESYQQVIALYDMADALITTVEKSPKTTKETHFQIVAPIVEQLEESTDVLTEEFITFAQQKGQKGSSSSRTKVESALRKIYAALDQYKALTQTTKKQALESVSNTVDPVIEKIKRQVEKVITIFVRFVELSLDRIMHKSDLELLKKREVTIATLLHNMSLSTAKTT